MQRFNWPKQWKQHWKRIAIFFSTNNSYGSVRHLHRCNQALTGFQHRQPAAPESPWEFRLPCQKEEWSYHPELPRESGWAGRQQFWPTMKSRGAIFDFLPRAKHVQKQFAAISYSSRGRVQNVSIFNTHELVQNQGGWWLQRWLTNEDQEQLRYDRHFVRIRKKLHHLGCLTRQIGSGLEASDRLNKHQSKWHNLVESYPMVAFDVQQGNQISTFGPIYLLSYGRRQV